MQNLLTFSRLRTETSKRMPLIIRHLDLFLKRCKITTFPEYMQTITINITNVNLYKILIGDTYFEQFLLIIHINALLYICLYLVNFCLYWAEEKIKAQSHTNKRPQRKKIMAKLTSVRHKT